MFSRCPSRALAVRRIFCRSNQRRFARLFVVLLVISLLLPPAAPVLAAGRAEGPSAAATNIYHVAQQEDEPDADDPYATEPAGPPEPVPFIPAVPIAGLDEADGALPAAPPPRNLRWCSTANA